MSHCSSICSPLAGPADSGYVRRSGLSPKEISSAVHRVPQEIRPQGAAVRRYEQLEDWIDSVFMLDGCLTAIVVGSCAIDPGGWLRHHTAGIGMEGTGADLPRSRCVPKSVAIGCRATTVTSGAPYVMLRTSRAVLATIQD